MSTTTLHNPQVINPAALHDRMAAGAAWRQHCQSLSVFELQVELAMRAGAAPPSMAWRESQIATVVLAGKGGAR